MQLFRTNFLERAVRVDFIAENGVYGADRRNFITKNQARKSITAWRTLFYRQFYQFSAFPQ